MLLRRRLGRSTNDRLREAVALQLQLGIDVSPDEHLAGVAAQLTEVEAFREGAGNRSLDFTFEMKSPH